METQRQILKRLLQEVSFDAIIDELNTIQDEINYENTLSDANLTIVTGLWDISRTGRSFDHYIENFKKFLKMPAKMFIYVPKELEHMVWQHRSKKNTHVRVFDLSDVKELYSPFWESTQNIRTSTDWLNQTGPDGWLKHSPQAVNEWYNPIVQSKMFMLHDAKVMNVFDTDYFIWLDAGITNTVYEKYFSDTQFLNKLPEQLSTFLFLSYPYATTSEIHGFKKEAMDMYANENVSYVCRGGLFGGHKDYISTANTLYYSVLNDSLSKGYMGTEESIFTIMSYLEPHVYKRYMLDDNGLIIKFIHDVLEGTVRLEPIKDSNPIVNVYNPSKEKTSLYVLSFNFPHQFNALLQSFEKHPEWLNHPRKILINNSSEQSIIDEYEQICQKYNFEHIKTGENLGINRGRLFAAKHFDESDSDYYFFFEDDMMLHSPDEVSYCRNGFRKFVPNLYNTLHEIIAREQFDFLKLSYTEVYMDNNIQVSWYNVPQSIRTDIWPDYDKLPITGLDPNAPKTKFDTIGVINELSYASGEIYYANWPMLVNKKGNYKMFLETEWQYPYEQTWMSYMFQKTRDGLIRPAVLLASPINHNRIAHYAAQDRREN